MVEGGAGANFPLFQLMDDRTGASTWNIENGREGLGMLGLRNSAYPAGTRLAITPDGSVGIGTVSPIGKLHVTGLGGPAASNWNTYTMARFSDGGQVSNSAITFDTGGTGTTAFRGFYFGKNSQVFHIGRFDAAGTEAPAVDFTILSNGNVGIGTINPQYKLAVNGNIGAQDIIVTNTGWSDYVFQAGYRLQPLSEVSQFIQTNGHLPDIPTEAEVKEQGVSLGDMQARLLAKVEELTLHMIRADERNNRLEQQNQELRERLARLEKGAAAGSTPAAAK